MTDNFLDYQLMTEDQQSLVDMIHEFMSKEMPQELVEKNDREGHFSMDVAKKLGEMGFYAMDVPEQYGGAGFDCVTICLIREALGYYCGGFANSFVGQSFGYKPLLLAGTEEQKMEYGQRLANGEFWATALTEPQGGSDAVNTRTKAVKDGDDYIINGNKCFVTNGGISNLYTVSAVTGETNLRGEGISLFIVERDFPGVSMGKHEDKMGIRASNTTELTLQDVRVPAKNLIGPVNTGYQTMMKMLARTRPTGCAPALGIARRAIDLAIDYSRQRITFGKPIGKHQGIQFKLADMAIRLQTARNQMIYNATLVDQGVYDTVVGSITKAYASEAAFQICVDAQQIFAGYGYSKEYPLEKLVRDARIYSIFEGPNEVQRWIIGNRLVGKIKK